MKYMQPSLFLIALLLLTGCSHIRHSSSSKFGPDDGQLKYGHDLAAYDEQYKGTRHERQAFDKSRWDQIETELRERPR